MLIKPKQVKCKEDIEIIGCEHFTDVAWFIIVNKS